MSVAARVQRMTRMDADAGLVEENRRRYNAHTDALLDAANGLEAAAKAIGSPSEAHFAAFGQMEADLLRQYGMSRESSVVDVGCGSGRLAIQLRQWLSGSYVGTDISSPLLDVARAACGRDDWQFNEVAGLEIAAPSDSADVTCFFSVLTHLRHEESYLYLQEASRVTRPGGIVVFSFLEFEVASHWDVFDATLNSLRADGGLHVNQFMSRDLISSWATHLGLEIEAIHRGDIPHIELSDPAFVATQNPVVGGCSNLGQSVAVLRVPS